MEKVTYGIIAAMNEEMQEIKKIMSNIHESVKKGFLKAVKLFIEHGFTWGGNWNSSKDYQHFQKVN